MKKIIYFLVALCGLMMIYDVGVITNASAQETKKEFIVYTRLNSEGAEGYKTPHLVTKSDYISFNEGDGVYNVFCYEAKDGQIYRLVSYQDIFVKNGDQLNAGALIETGTQIEEGY